MILETKNLSIKFGGLQAVKNVDLKLEKGELIGLIGPNGAGKTTIFNLLTGVYLPDSESEIYINGKDITKLDTYKRVKEGIVRTFQNIRLFKEKTVLENVKMALDTIYTYNIFDAIFRTKKYKNIEREMTKKSLEILDIFDMTDMVDLKAGNLSYGRQRKLEIARALATNPKILLLDEPAAGMNPQETIELMEIIKTIKEKFDLTILLIEHDMNLVMGICEKIYVLNFGEVLCYGLPDEIKNNEDVIKAYLGSDVDA